MSETNEVERSLLRQLTINRTGDVAPWLTDHQREDLRSQLLHQPNRTLLEGNEAVQALREQKEWLRKHGGHA